MGAWPALFVAHGSPMLALEGGALADLGPSLTAPRAILVCSAHWEVPGAFRLSSTERPGGLHDFGGFPEKFYALDYPARPLDHGAWAKAFQGWVDDRLAVGDTPREYTQLTVQSLLAVHTESVILVNNCPFLAFSAVSTQGSAGPFPEFRQEPAYLRALHGSVVSSHSLNATPSQNL